MSDNDWYPGGWFGPSWGAPVNEEGRHLAIPIGEACMYCNGRFRAGDQGLTMPHVGEGGASLVSVHIDCFRHEIGAPT